MIAIKRTMRTLMGVTLLGAGVSVAGAALPQGEAIVGTMTVQPTTVAPGDSYVISNDPESPCLLGQVSGDTGGVRPGAWFVEPDENGDWSVTIEVPDSGPPDAMGNPTPFPEGPYEQHAFCEAAVPTAAGFSAFARQQAEFSYEPVTVNVVAQEEPTPPPAPAPEAEAEEAEPTFTG
jgi:hypothetical protein